MADVPSSNTQDRVMRLFGLLNDGTYAHASQVLEAAGLPSDGVPAGMTWRSVKKLSDDELRAVLPASAVCSSTVPTLAEQREAAQREHQQRRLEQRERDRTNAFLREHGFHWTRMALPDSPSPLMDDWQERWVLLDPQGNVTTVASALAEIRNR